MEIGSGKASFQIADKEPEGKGILAVKSSGEMRDRDARALRISPELSAASLPGVYRDREPAASIP